MARKPSYGVDPMCHDIAEHFLSNVKGATGMDKQELAEAVQRLCEQFCGGLAAYMTKKPRQSNKGD